MSCFSEWGLSDKWGYRDNDPSVHRRHVLGWPPLWLLAVAVILVFRKPSSEPLFQWIYTVKWDEAHPMSTDRLTDGWAQGDNEQWNWSLWQWSQQMLGSFLLRFTVSENFRARSGGEQQGPGSPFRPKGAAKVEIWQKGVLMTSSSGQLMGHNCISRHEVGHKLTLNKKDGERQDWTTIMETSTLMRRTSESWHKPTGLCQSNKWRLSSMLKYSQWKKKGTR